MTETRRGARRQRKAEVRRFLQDGDLDAIAERARGHGARTLREVTRLLFDRDEALRWRAATATGRVAAVLAEGDLEAVRELIRRVMWWMNDESGALLWSGPQVMAEVMVHVPAMRAEYGHILPHYLNEEPFEQGASWALWRLSAVDPDAARAAEPWLLAALDHGDPGRRGPLRPVP